MTPIEEAPLEDGSAAGPGWFVLNLADAQWVDGVFGAYTRLDAGHRFEQVGVNVAVLQPGQPACWYHREADQEGFLVLQGEAIALVEGQERRLRTWDFLHCPAWTEHVLIGAGDGPCTLLALGARTSGGGVVYPASELALSHRAGVREETDSAFTAYAGTPADERVTFDPDWLP